MPRAGVSIPNDSTTQFAFRNTPEHTGIKTRMLRIKDNLGNSILFILKLRLKLKPLHNNSFSKYKKIQLQFDDLVCDN
jgi:hypothetical protein